MTTMFQRYEVEYTPGLLDVVQNELQTVIPATTVINVSENKGILQLETTLDPAIFQELQTVQAVYGVLRFDVPRPKALLGHQNFHQLANAIDSVRDRQEHTFTSIALNAAGAGSSVMQRLMQQLSQHTHLRLAQDEGDLLLRLRRGVGHKGWDALVRLTPRPLSTRDWRVADMEGALNGPVARAMNHLTNPTIGDHYLNAGCGSGTYLIERAAIMPFTRMIGLDNRAGALAAARANITASGSTGIELIQGDMRTTPFQDSQFDVIIVDLPFGNLVGDHTTNASLYPAFLQESRRLLQQNGRLVLLTHEVRLMERLLRDSHHWHVIRETIINLRGLHPRIYILEQAI